MIGIELEKAIELILYNISFCLKTEKLPIHKCNGRVLAEDIISTIDVPPFNRSPLDGYALISHDTLGASKNTPVKLKVVDEIFAGSYSTHKLKQGEAIRIMTGAPMPEGSDCVIRQEDTDFGEDFVQIYRKMSPNENYSFSGEDIKKGSLVVKNGEHIRYTHQAVIATIGKDSVYVRSKPKIAVIVTGDELCEIGKPLTYGKIYDSNLYLISSRLLEFGIEPAFSTYVPDDANIITDIISKIIDDVDMIITSGGVSVGKKDIIHEVIPMLGAKRIFWKLNLKPGSPAIFSIYNEKPILSLSGNPFAAITTFELLARPILAKLCHDPSLLPETTVGVMESDFNKKSNKRRFIRAIYKNGKVTIPSSEKLYLNSSGLISSMMDCNCLVDIKPGNMGLSIGDTVDVIII